MPSRWTLINHVSWKNIIDTLTAEWQRTSYCRCWRRYHRYKCLSANFSRRPVIWRDSCASMYASMLLWYPKTYIIVLNRPFLWINLCNRPSKAFSWRCLLIPIAISAIYSWLLGLLGQTSFSEDIPHIVRSFDKITKLRFRNANEPLYIKFGSIRDNDPMLNIRSGQLKLLGYASNNRDLLDVLYLFLVPTSPPFSNRPLNALWSLSKSSAKPPKPKYLWGIWFDIMCIID